MPGLGLGDGVAVGLGDGVAVGDGDGDGLGDGDELAERLAEAAGDVDVAPVVALRHVWPAGCAETTASALGENDRPANAAAAARARAARRRPRPAQKVSISTTASAPPVPGKYSS